MNARSNPLKVICPYCSNPAQFRSSSAGVYRSDFGPIYICDGCQAWVGVHKGTVRPLGRLANRELRSAKRRAHAVFEPLWQEAPEFYHDRKLGRRAAQRVARTLAYHWLAQHMGLPVNECHIGEFDVEQCQRVCQIIIDQRASPATIRDWAERNGHSLTEETGT